MKMILAIMRPERLEEVQTALLEIGVSGFTAMEGRGFGSQGGYIECYRGLEYKVSSVTKVRIEIAVPEDQVDAAVQAICRAAFTGEVGDGKIFIYGLDECIRVRTGEINEASI